MTASRRAAGNGSASPRVSRRRVPIYVKIQRYLLGEIGCGRLRRGDRVPTEADIARRFATSRATVQHAMSRLVFDGVVDRCPGRGTFVSGSEPSAQIDLHVDSFEEQVARRGRRVEFRLLHFGRTTASRETATILSLRPGDEVFALERLRLVDGAIVGLERRDLRCEIGLAFPVAALETEPTHRLVERHAGTRIDRLDAAIRAAVADADLAKKLRAAVGAPLLARKHTVFAAGDRAILCGESFYREPFAFQYSARAADPAR